MATAKKVRVRMYRQGLGDCFLLTFPGARKPVHVLIDCGVVLGAPTSLLPKVAAHIATTTKKRLDLVIATHEHWDHLCGFVHAAAQFKDISMDKLWVAWTEKPGDPLAGELRKLKAASLAAARRAIARLSARPPTGMDASVIRRRKALAVALGEVVGFDGPPLAAAKRAAAETASTAQALHDLIARFPEGDRTYLEPGGQTHAIPGVKDVRVYVLGPPRDTRLLHRDRPRKGEVYELAAARAARAGFMAALGVAAGDATDPEIAQLSYPFDQQHWLTADAARALPFFRDRYGFGDGDGEPWRRIDEDWLEAAGDLALNLDSDTNNTSVALAIELLPSRQVLLFPGDAQVGSWESWNAHEWRVDGEKVSVSDLLSRVVLYKVSHHASHNGTPKANGLERMTSDDLAALVPVHQAQATKKHWPMPHAPLMRALQKRARGRVIRMDRKLPSRPAGLTAAEWTRFTRRVKTNDLYFDIEIPLA